MIHNNNDFTRPINGLIDLPRILVSENNDSFQIKNKLY